MYYLSSFEKSLQDWPNNYVLINAKYYNAKKLVIICNIKSFIIKEFSKSECYLWFSNCVNKYANFL